jgi:hypothetical protein
VGSTPKLGVAVTQHTMKIDELARLVDKQGVAHPALAAGATTNEYMRAGGTARLEVVEKHVTALMEHKPSRWPAIVSAIASVLMFLPVVGGLLCLGPGG